MLTCLFSQEKITKMESELFILNLRDPKLAGMMKGDNGRVADGSPSHFAGALKLGLKKAIELKRRSKGVLLQCPGCGGKAYFNSNWYTPDESGPFCTNCPSSWNRTRMECGFCRNSGMVGDYASCQNNCRSVMVSY